MHDPFAMRPFVGYNMGDYFAHWANFGKQDNLKLPKIFHVNWFRKDADGKFLWPGFGDNVRVLDWIMRRVDEGPNNPNTAIATETPIGIVPKTQGFDLNGLEHVNWDELFRFDRGFWEQEVEQIRTYFDNNIGADMPSEVKEQVQLLTQRVINN